MISRRRFLISTAQAIGLAATGGVLWGGHLSTARAAPLVLRPPGALKERRFQAACTKCGICVAACPYDALMLAAPGDGLPIGTPYFIPRQTPCYMCTDIPCAISCPTGALDPSLLIDNSSPREPDINLARIGLAVIDRETCIAFWGMRCDVCYRACPRIDLAIKIEYIRNDRTGRHALLSPAVDSNHCTGCGICEHVCVTQKASITVLPIGLAKGESQARYLRGWAEQDEEKLRTLPEDTTTVTPKSVTPAVDYLNREP